MAWGRSILSTCVVCASVGVAAADVDLTGSWKVETFFSDVTLNVVQSNTFLDLGGYRGTIDVATGAFSLQGGSSPGGLLLGSVPYGPSPVHTMEGTASLDGNSFEATTVIWVPKINPPWDGPFPWAGFSSPAHGTRLTADSCGDPPIDAGEGDDPIPACGAPLTVEVAGVNESGRLRARGILSAQVGTISEVTVLAGATGPRGIPLQCAADPGDAGRVRCSSDDESVRVLLSRSRSSGDWSLRLRVDGLMRNASAAGPITIEIVDRMNGRAAGAQLSRCRRLRKSVFCSD